MARFSIEKDDNPEHAWLRDVALGGKGRGSCIHRADADEIRRLLDEAFPVDLICEECGDPVVPMKNKPGLYKHSCPVQTAQQPATDDPDPDEVRQLLDIEWLHRPNAKNKLVDAAARAWLRMREQQPEPCPTIAQVIEACEAAWPCDAEAKEWHVYFCRRDDDSYSSYLERFDRARAEWRGVTPEQATADTPEAAIRALYDDAVAKLKQQRDEAQTKLRKLGVEPCV